MRPELSRIGEKDNERIETVQVQRALGEALRLSYSRMIKDHLPSEVALALVRLAVLEILRDGIDDEFGSCDSCEAGGDQGEAKS